MKGTPTGPSIPPETKIVMTLYTALTAMSKTFFYGYNSKAIAHTSYNKGYGHQSGHEDNHDNLYDDEHLVSYDYKH